MKWFELQEKAKVKLHVDLRVLDKSRVDAYLYLTPSDLDELAPIAHKKGTWFTAYPKSIVEMVELFNEQTDDVLFMHPEDEIPCHFTVL